LLLAIFCASIDKEMNVFLQLVLFFCPERLVQVVVPKLPQFQQFLMLRFTHELASSQ
jgi:hypothetical protein